ncbi:MULTISPECIES: hypothetical protein [Pigmentiphaga]|jgi:hypothetical protein|uniref:Uncharacterized protein n=1 Tax=Pigmentiphaga daeguensis TaxID=414049 RepID=A0ABN1BR00_9BURK|nr:MULTISPECIES: hypothetical protein [unclassified Pigmentiphaga]OVZ64507.1 hypothetical protein CDO46_07920 [Pigmentiphaga sp. NML030171]
MIKFDIKMPSTDDLMRAAMAEIEKNITQRARRAAAPHGGVTVKFERTPNGTIKAVNFQGSEAAIKAAQATFKD